MLTRARTDKQGIAIVRAEDKSFRAAVMTELSTNRSMSSVHRSLLLLLLFLLLLLLLLLPSPAISLGSKSSTDCLLVGWLFNVPATCESISDRDLIRQLYVLPH